VLNRIRYLANEEMEFITVDKWDENVWGIEHKTAESKIETPKLVFYFAAQVQSYIPFSSRARINSNPQDHWVANHTRDTLISARGKLDDDLSSSRPEMTIDRNGITHAFCIGMLDSHWVPNFGSRFG
jgi:hypothetical protein